MSVGTIELNRDVTMVLSTGEVYRLYDVDILSCDGKHVHVLTKWPTP